MREQTWKKKYINFIFVNKNYSVQFNETSVKPFVRPSPLWSLTVQIFNSGSSRCQRLTQCTDLRLRSWRSVENQIVEVAARRRRSKPITKRGEQMISVFFRFYLQLPQTGFYQIISGEGISRSRKRLETFRFFRWPLTPSSFWLPSRIQDIWFTLGHKRGFHDSILNTVNYCHMSSKKNLV